MNECSRKTKMLRFLMALGIAMSLPFPVAGQPLSRDGIKPSFVPNELIILLNHGTSAPAPEEIVNAVNQRRQVSGGLGIGNPVASRFVISERATKAARGYFAENPYIPEALLQRYIVLTFPSVVDLDRVAQALERNPNVLWTGKNWLGELSATEPNDPFFDDNPGGGSRPPEQHQWGSYSLHLPEAWDYTKGHSYVGIVDIGIDTDHPDLRPFDASGHFIGGNFRPHLSRDYGYDDDDVDEGQSQGGETVLFAGHGTHVSGIVGATPNNSKGVAGVCWNCSLLVSKVSTICLGYNGCFTDSDISDGITGAIGRGAQVLNVSLGYPSGAYPSCATQPLKPLCVALQLLENRDTVMTAAAGNDGGQASDFPAVDPRVIAVGGIQPGGSFWNDCPTQPGTDCGSNRSANQIVAPAKQVYSTFYVGLSTPANACNDSADGVVDGYGLCTGTSMASPYAAGVVGILRSINPLLTKANVKSLLTSNVENPVGWDPANGIGKPNVYAAVRAALGKANNAVLTNRLTPLFQLYSSVAEDYVYTTFPQMATGFQWSSSDYYSPSSAPQVGGYGPYFPGGKTCSGSPCDRYARASVYIFTTERSPSATVPLVPLYRMSFEGTFPGGPNNPNNRDHTYTIDTAGIDGFAAVGYRLDGIEGYIFKRCSPEPSCIPAGAVRLWRQYHYGRDDHAIFPESELAQWQAAGYTSVPTENDILGYVYPNVDSDGDNLIDGFEGLLGTNPALADSDCDGLSDGTEVLNYPYGDPLGSPGCALPPPPVANFSFACTGLSCSFNGTGSTGSGITYAWSFGDSTNGTGSTASRQYGVTGSYAVALTVTDPWGQQSSKSKKVSVNGDSPLPAESYFTVAPCRLVDTRTSAPLSSGQLYIFNVAGNCGIPATAKAVSFNMGVSSATGPGHLVFYPGNQSSGPFANSTMNFLADPTPRFNNAVLRLATNGAGTLALSPFVYATGQLHFILDVYGYFSEDTTPVAGAQGPLGYQTVTPCRIADTRTTASPLTHGIPRNFAVQGSCGVPAGAAAAMLNPVSVTPSEAGYIELFQAGTPVPFMATLGFPAGIFAQANGARTRLSASTPDVTVQFTGASSQTGTSHFVLDAYGYFKSDAPLKYRPVTPCRLVDTRLADQGAPAMAANETRTFQVQGNCGIPVGAKAAMLNIVAAAPTGFGRFTAFPSDTAQPAASLLNFSPNQGNLANGAILPLSTNANDLAIYTNSDTHLIIDVFGYFQ